MLREALPSGSYLAISHFRDISGSHDADASQIAAVQKLLSTGNWRNHETVLSYFADLEVIDPGLVPILEWRPDPALRASGTPGSRSGSAE